MNEKISFPDLVTLLSTKMNVTKKDAEAFLKEFFTIATEVITSGEELKINELGQFKPIWVEARSSVNVQTGEPVEIPGHYKLSFLPDKVLRDAVNAPFASFAVEVLNDHVSIEEMLPPASEVAEMVQELPDDAENPQTSPIEEVDETTPNHEPDAVAPVAVEEPETIIAPIVEEPKIAIPEEEPVTEEPITPAEEPEIPTREDAAETSEYRYDDDEQEANSRRAFWWGALSVLGIVILGFVAAFIVLSNAETPCVVKVGDYTLSITRGGTERHEAVIHEVAPVVEDTIQTAAEDTTLVKAEPDTVSILPIEAEEVTVETKPVEDTIRPGVFLTTLARKHFGHKAFWVYIYEENKSRIKNPDQIPIGTRVVIPEASKYGIDANNQSSVATAKELARTIQQQKRQ